ncbi:hypothetical protein VTK56DRAFT_5570 [Thermocarpiscus australiensis]
MEHPKPRTSALATPRRSFTGPVPPSAPQSASSLQSAGGLVDTLYDHPNVKIVAFTAGSRALSAGLRAAAAPDAEPGSLSWSSQLERTIAVGPFRIYRAPGSVAFLSCGSALQPILPKSQVWCVDEQSSKFVLQIRRPNYWRIEVPVEEQEDRHRAQLLREVFDKILQFEKTECPFKRSFTVELPERPQTPVKKRPWTPVRRSSASLPLTPVTPVEIARLHRGTPRGSISLGDARSRIATGRALGEQSRRLEPPAKETLSRESEKQSTVPELGYDALPRPDLLKESHEDSSWAGPRQQAVAITAPHSNVLESIPVDVPTEITNQESGRFIPLSPSPPMSTPVSPLSPTCPSKTGLPPQTPVKHQETANATLTSKPSQTWSVATADSLSTSECSAATAPSSIQDIDSSSTCSAAAPPEDSTQLTYTSVDEESPGEPLETPMSSPTPSASSTALSPTHTRRPPIRRTTTSSSRISPSRRTALSPVPSAADLFTPRHHHQQQQQKNNNNNDNNPSSNANTTTATDTTTSVVARVRRLPMTVIHKTCEILLAPPSHLLSLMLRVAARIAAGEWRGLVFGTGEGGERVSVRWDWSDDDDDDDVNEMRRSGRARGYRYGYGYGWPGDEFWAGTGTGRGRRWKKMAGAFPESDEDDDDDYEDENENEQGEGEVGIRLGRSRAQSLSLALSLSRSRSQSPGGGEEKADERLTPDWIGRAVRELGGGRDDDLVRDRRADAERGVD